MSAFQGFTPGTILICLLLKAHLAWGREEFYACISA